MVGRKKKQTPAQKRADVGSAANAKRRKAKSKALSTKQLRFAQEYVVDHNATQAAIRAGYSLKTACSQGCRVLRYVGVAAEIERLEKRLLRKIEVTAEKIVHGYAQIAFPREQPGIPFPSQTDTLKALDKLGQHHAMFSENVVRPGGGDQPVSPEQQRADLLRAMGNTKAAEALEALGEAIEDGGGDDRTR